MRGLKHVRVFGAPFLIAEVEELITRVVVFQFHAGLISGKPEGFVHHFIFLFLFDREGVYEESESVSNTSLFIF